MSILSLGSIGIDEIITPSAESGRVVGGSVIYFAWSASAFYQPIHIVSVVGNDFPESEFELLKKRHVNVDGVQKIADQKTFYWKGSYHADMNNRDSLVTDLNVLQSFRPVLPAHYQHPDWVMLGNLDPNLQLSVLDQIQHRPQFIALDTMNFWMESAFLPALKKVIPRVDLLFLNDTEAMQLSGETSLKRAIASIQRMGAKFLCIKRSEYGSILAHQDQVFICPAFLLDQVTDPTGAGDSFAGGVMGYLAGQNHTPDFSTLKRSVIAGTAMASFCVEKFSNTAFLDLTANAIKQRMDTIQQFITLG